MSEESVEEAAIQPQVLAVLEHSIRYGKAVGPARLYTAVELAQQAAVKGRVWHALEILEMAGHNFTNSPRGFKLVPLDAEPVAVEIVEQPARRRGARCWQVRIRARFADREAEIRWDVYYYTAFNTFTVEPSLEWLFEREQQAGQPP